MAGGNRLSAEQLASLAPGDAVVSETSGDFRRPRYSTGTVIHFEARHIVVWCRSLRGVPYVT